MIRRTPEIQIQRRRKQNLESITKVGLKPMSPSFCRNFSASLMPAASLLWSLLSPLSAVSTFSALVAVAIIPFLANLPSLWFAFLLFRHHFFSASLDVACSQALLIRCPHGSQHRGFLVQDRHSRRYSWPFFEDFWSRVLRLLPSEACLF